MERDIQVITDPSCYHASLSVLLSAGQEETDPVLALGGNVATAATLDAAGNLEFHDPLPAMQEALAYSGHQLIHEPLPAADPLSALVSALRVHQAVAVTVDAFHLEHYWDKYQIDHAPHTVTLLDYDQNDQSVRMIDAVDQSYFDARLRVQGLIPALAEPGWGQSWMALEKSGPPQWTSESKLVRDFQRYSRGLRADGGAWLGGVELVTVLRDTADDHLELIRRAADPADNAPELERAHWLREGLWIYFNHLRWFARHLEVLADYFSLELDDLTRTVTWASREALVVRTLLDRCSASGSTNHALVRQRLDVSMQTLAGHLASAGKNLDELAATLSGASS